MQPLFPVLITSIFSCIKMNQQNSKDQKYGIRQYIDRKS